MSAADAHRDEVSRYMGQLLLKSYALLDEYCDVCTTPLMRNPNGSLVCASCHLRSAKKAKHSPDHEMADAGNGGGSSGPNEKCVSSGVLSSDVVKVSQNTESLDICESHLVSVLTQKCQKLEKGSLPGGDEGLLKEINLLLESLLKLRQLKSQ